MLQLVEPPKNHQVQLLEHFRAKQKLKDIIKGIVLMPLDHCQAQGINQLSRKPIPMFSLTVKNIFLMSGLNLIWCSFVTHKFYHWISGRPVPPTPLLFVMRLQRAMRSSFSIFFSRTSPQIFLFATSPQPLHSRPFISSAALLCMLSRSLTSFFCWEAENLHSFPR